MISDRCELDRFKELTWEAIEEWAGKRTLSRGQSYQRGGRVDELAGTLLRDLMTRLGKGEEWRRYLASLRQTNARKPRLLQTLATLEGRKIIDGRE